MTKIKWPKNKTCGICDTSFLVSPKQYDTNNEFKRQNARFCSKQCQLDWRKIKNTTRYSEQRKEYRKKWYDENGEEYYPDWRKKNKKTINKNQRKRRTGDYGYKYETRKQAIKNGYRSGYEQSICESLKGNNTPFEYETHVIKWVDTKEKKYIPDIILFKENGEPMFLELKGWFHSADRTKMLNVQKCNPTLDIRFVFQNSKTKLNKKSKTTYGKWAEKHGFKWACKTIPEEWLEE